MGAFQYASRYASLIVHPDTTALQKWSCFEVRSVVLFAIVVPDLSYARDIAIEAAKGAKIHLYAPF